MTINKYRFSFTATSLRTKDFIEVVKWDSSNDKRDLELKLGNGKHSTGKRLLMEIVNWVDVLTDEQIDLLKNESYDTQNKVAFLAICKCYDFIRDFIVEVVREKYIVYDFEITEGEYLSFFRRKAIAHPEMDKLTELTQDKIKQVTFKMLEQAGIIDNIRSRTIQPQLLEPMVQKAIVNDNSEYLKVFLYSDMDIKRLIEAYE